MKPSIQCLTRYRVVRMTVVIFWDMGSANDAKPYFSGNAQKFYPACYFVLNGLCFLQQQSWCYRDDRKYVSHVGFFG